MEREIKFRAFVRGYMVNVVSIDFIDQYITWDDNQYDRCVPPNKCYEIESFDEIKLMQYTGLHDKNGKEIYEGDVLKMFLSGKPIGADERVEFKDGSFWLRYRHIPLRNWICEPEFDGECEVIGNLYEHPELISKVKP